MSDIYEPRELVDVLRRQAEAINGPRGHEVPELDDHVLNEAADTIERLLADRLKMLAYQKLWERQNGVPRE